MNVYCECLHHGASCVRRVVYANWTKFPQMVEETIVTLGHSQLYPKCLDFVSYCCTREVTFPRQCLAFCGVVKVQTSRVILLL